MLEPNDELKNPVIEGERDEEAAARGELCKEYRDVRTKIDIALKAWKDGAPALAEEARGLDVELTTAYEALKHSVQPTWHPCVLQRSLT